MIVLLIVIALVVGVALIIVMRKDPEDEPDEVYADEALTEEESIVKETSPVAEEDWLAEMFTNPPEPVHGKHEKGELQGETGEEKPRKKTEHSEGHIKPDRYFEDTIVYEPDQRKKAAEAPKPKKKQKPSTLQSYPVNPGAYTEEPLIIRILTIICGFTGVVTFFIVAAAWYVYVKRNGM